MSITQLLGAAVSGLTASQAGMRSVANNIANAQSVGYARTRTTYAPVVTSGVGSGTKALELERVADRFLDKAMYVTRGEAARTNAEAAHLGRVSSLIGDLASGGLSSRVAGIQTALVELGTTPGPAGPQRLVANIGSAIDEAGRVLEGIRAIRDDASDEIARLVPRANDLLARVQRLNDDVVKATLLGRSTSGPADQRTATLAELAELIGIETREDTEGRVFVETRGGQVLVDRRARSLADMEGVASRTATPVKLEVRLVDDERAEALPLAQPLDPNGVGGRLGGLIGLRDRVLPSVAADIAEATEGVAVALNRAATRSSAVPPPGALTGRDTGLGASDPLRLTGRVGLMATDSSGRVVNRLDLDLGAVGTVGEAVSLISSGLAPHARASFAGGRLTLEALSPSTGLVVADDPVAPSNRDGASFADFFGLGHVVETPSGRLPTTVLASSDAHGMAPGQFVTLAVSAAPGRPARTWTFEPAAAGPAFSDVLAALNAGPLAEAGEFRFERGQLHLAASGGERSLAAVSDGTRRFDTGAGFASLMGIRATTPAAGLQMKASILEAPQKFPLGLPVAAARVGERATTNGREGADVFLNEFLGQARGSQPGGVDRALAGALGNLGAIVRNADSRHADAADRASEAQDRRDGFSGVNIDEEMALMMVLQNSYAASARVLTAVQSMADTLLGMLR